MRWKKGTGRDRLVPFFCFATSGVFLLPLAGMYLPFYWGKDFRMPLYFLLSADIIFV